MRFGIIKSAKRILFPITVTLLLILSTFIMLIASADDVPFDPFNPFPQGGGNVLAPTAWGVIGNSNIGYYSSYVIHNSQEYGGFTPTLTGANGNFTDLNPRNLNYNNWNWIATNQFNHSGNFGIIPAYSNITITNVKAYLIAPDHLKNGWFSVKISPANLATAAPWLSGSMAYSTMGAGVNTTYLYNSTLFPHKIAGGFPFTFPCNTWDITSITNWTFAKITNVSTTVMWTTNENTTIGGHDYIDYLGLWWQYYADFNYTGGGGTLIPSFSDNFNSILWLLIVFAPALALQFMLPKIGYAFGMFLMLFIFGLTQTNFMYVTIIGISALGIMLYKGD